MPPTSEDAPHPPGPAAPDWTLWQLLDSAFPTGGFAHSGGLEAAWQQGEVGTRSELERYLEASLLQTAQGALPLAAGVHRNPQRLAELDRLAQAFTANHVANRASRLQGRAFWTAVQRIFGPPPSDWSPPPFHHFAPLFGAAMRQLGIPLETLRWAFLFGQLRTVLAAAVRLNIVGPMEAQVLQARRQPDVTRLLQRTAGLAPEDIAQPTPLFDLWQGAQDRLYSRLFQS